MYGVDGISSEIYKLLLTAQDHEEPQSEGSVLLAKYQYLNNVVVSYLINVEFGAFNLISTFSL